MLKLIQVLLCFVLINTLRAQPLFVKDSLKSFIQEGMKKWQIPGLALVVVKDGKVVTKEGYGIRNLETREKVDAHILFYIASNTKLFTGTALANLAYVGYHQRHAHSPHWNQNFSGRSYLLEFQIA